MFPSEKKSKLTAKLIPRPNDINIIDNHPHPHTTGLNSPKANPKVPLLTSSKPPLVRLPSLSNDAGIAGGQEHEIVANIQELQRRLSMLQCEQQTSESTLVEDALTPGEEGLHSENADLASSSSSPSSSRSGGGSNSQDQPYRLIMVSNRLPISITRNPDSKEYVFTMTSGGLVTALAGIRSEVPFIWIGWLGMEIELDQQPLVREKLLREYHCLPVFLTQELASNYYNEFSNNVLWPIFHYVPLPDIFRVTHGPHKRHTFQHHWQAYQRANGEFAKVIAQVYREGDYIWIHDYHLMVLPSILRQKFPSSKIGWFLHTPFPSSEVYRVLPVRQEILEGLLGADLVGFHTYDYVRHFLSCCGRILGIQSTPKGMELLDGRNNGNRNHFVSVGVFPIGVEPEQFLTKLEQPATKIRIAQLLHHYRDTKKIIIGVDRLDYIKGMPHKMLAMERFLMKHPEWQNQVVLIQIAVPSRTQVEEYQRLCRRVNELVGRINGTFGTVSHTPVHYINQSVSQEELVALYHIADVCFVTSVRDGMNLVSHEYVICQHQKTNPGVLVLSEFAGSAQSLSGAIRVNPWNTDQMAQALFQALSLPLIEREVRQMKLYRYVQTHTASFWAKSFLKELKYATARSQAITKLTSKLPMSDIVQAYGQSRNRLIICDYDGTLTPWQSLPMMAGPKLYLRKIIAALVADPKNTVMIVSGRERTLLGHWFQGIDPLVLAAESGFFFRMKPHREEASITHDPDQEDPNPNEQPRGSINRIEQDDGWTAMGQDYDPSWSDVVRPILQYFAERTPRSFIETKHTALSWHYNDTDPEFGTMQARDLQIHLEDVLSNLPIEVVQGNKLVEVRLQGISKEISVQELCRRVSTPEVVQEKGPIDFVFCVGDDVSDEVMFTSLAFAAASSSIAVDNPPNVAENDIGGNIDDRNRLAFSKQANVYTCHIGTDRSEAMYYLETVSELRRLLRTFVASSRGDMNTT